MSKPNIPKGTRDFSPEEVAKRNYIFNVLKSYFQQFGFLPIETPSIEKLSTLTGKYGDEGDQLLFKLLKRGAKFEQALNQASKSEGISDHQFSEEALRYDLTVPFARYVVQHLNDILFLLKDTKYNLFGEQIDLKEVGIGSFINVMLMWLVQLL